MTSYDAASVIAPTLAPGASLSFAARGSFAFPCAGHARLATTATLRLDSGFSSGEHAGVLKWACGAPAAGAPKVVMSGVIAAPAAVGRYRFLGQSHYAAQATVSSALAGSELRWKGVLEGTLAAAEGTHGSNDVLRLAFDGHIGTFGLAAAQKQDRLPQGEGSLGAMKVDVITSWLVATLAVSTGECSGSGSRFTGQASFDLAWLNSVGKLAGAATGFRSCAGAGDADADANAADAAGDVVWYIAVAAGSAAMQVVGPLPPNLHTSSVRLTKPLSGQFDDLTTRDCSCVVVGGGNSMILQRATVHAVRALPRGGGRHERRRRHGIWLPRCFPQHRRRRHELGRAG